jgi:hypothetical protein
MNITKSLAMLGLAGVLAGCKVGVIVPEGGTVQSLSDTRNCPESRNCFYETLDFTFDETFTAVPNEGWQFVKWNSGNGFFCEDSTSLSCRTSTVGLAGVTGGASAVASDMTLYIMPLFKFVGIDTDGDGIKDHVDEDDDNDGIFDVDDAYPLDPNKSSLEDDMYVLDGSDGRITATIAPDGDTTLYTVKVENIPGTFELVGSASMYVQA